MAYRGSQARGQTGAVTAGLCHSHSKMGSKPVCNLHQSSWQCWIPNPLSEARDQTCVLMDASQIHFCCSTMGAPLFYFTCSWETCPWSILQSENPALPADSTGSQAGQAQAGGSCPAKGLSPTWWQSVALVPGLVLAQAPLRSLVRARSP